MVYVVPNLRKSANRIVNRFSNRTYSGFARPVTAKDIFNITPSSFGAGGAAAGLGLVFKRGARGSIKGLKAVKNTIEFPAKTFGFAKNALLTGGATSLLLAYTGFRRGRGDTFKEILNPFGTFKAGKKAGKETTVIEDKAKNQGIAGVNMSPFFPFNPGSSQDSLPSTPSANIGEVPGQVIIGSPSLPSPGGGFFLTGGGSSGLGAGLIGGLIGAGLLALLFRRKKKKKKKKTKKSKKKRKHK